MYDVMSHIIVKAGLVGKEFRISEAEFRNRPPLIKIHYTKDLEDGSTLVRFEQEETFP